MLFKKKKVNVDKEMVHIILDEFVQSFKDVKIILCYSINKRRWVKLYTNRPGIFIGKHGLRIKALTEKLINEANVKDTRIYEIKHMINNCGIY